MLAVCLLILYLSSLAGAVALGIHLDVECSKPNNTYWYPARESRQWTLYLYSKIESTLETLNVCFSQNYSFLEVYDNNECGVEPSVLYRGVLYLEGLF